MIVGTSTSCSGSCVAPQNRAHRDVLRKDLGHFDNVLWNRQKEVKEAHDVRQLFHHLRHRSVEKLYHRGMNGNLLHGTRQISLLWPPRLTQTGWPGTPGRHHVFVGELVVLGACRVGRRSRPELGRALRLALLLPDPGRLLSP